ncbi:MAG: response regulator [Polyangiales bacterium]
MPLHQGDSPSAPSVLLRVELVHHGRSVVTHTVELGEQRMSIASELLVARNEELTLQLSFPGLVDPCALTARVLDVRPDAGFGSPRTIELEIVQIPEHGREQLTRLVSKEKKITARPPRLFRCLVVEDNALIRDMFAHAIGRYFKDRRAPVSLEVANDGEEAWRKLGEAHYDLAIVDHYLPKLSGADLIARVRAHPLLSKLAVIAISVGGPEARSASISAGADLFLDKPVVMRDLVTTLDRLTTE